MTSWFRSARVDRPGLTILSCLPNINTTIEPGLAQLPFFQEDQARSSAHRQSKPAGRHSRSPCPIRMAKLSV